MQKDTSIKKSYWAVTPATVRYDKKLPDGAKLLYGEITALCNERGYCWASNEYFADLYGNDPRTISRWVSALAKRDHIFVKLVGKERKIFLTQNIDTSKLPDDQDMPAEAVDETEVTEEGEQKKSKAKPIEKKYTEEDMQLAQLLLQKIVYNFPAFENKKVKLPEWADEIRKLREIDKATHEQILFMIMWVHGGEVAKPGHPTRKFEPHDFWARNIMSAKKLRKQWFDNLVPQLQQAFTKAVKKNVAADLSGNGVPATKKSEQVAQL